MHSRPGSHPRALGDQRTRPETIAVLLGPISSRRSAPSVAALWSSTVDPRDNTAPVCRPSSRLRCAGAKSERFGCDPWSRPPSRSSESLHETEKEADYEAGL